MQDPSNGSSKKADFGACYTGALPAAVHSQRQLQPSRVLTMLRLSDCSGVQHAMMCSSDSDDAEGQADEADGRAVQEQPAARAVARPGERLDDDGNAAEKKTKAPRPKLTYGHLTVRSCFCAFSAQI
jgi:hypothetical protein